MQNRLVLRLKCGDSMKKNLFLLSAVLILAALFYLVFYCSFFGKKPNGLVRIYVGHQLFAQEALQDERDIEIRQESGQVNVLHLTSNGFYMKDANCLTHQCIDQGEVTTQNYPHRALGTKIICAHHNLWAELVLIEQTPPPEMPDI